MYTVKSKEIKKQFVDISKISQSTPSQSGVKTLGIKYVQVSGHCCADAFLKVNSPKIKSRLSVDFMMLKRIASLGGCRNIGILRINLENEISYLNNHSFGLPR